MSATDTPGPDLSPTGDAGIVRVQQALRDWVQELALPFWADAGLDLPGRDGRFRGACERLTLAGRPDYPGFKRLRVQARQLYVFSEAARRGVYGTAAIAAALHRFMSRNAADGEGGWPRWLDRDGAALDPTLDLYDLAFVMFSLGHHARATGDSEPLRQAGRVLDLVERHLAHPAGGYANTDPAEPGWRQQNPHMHLLEAALALFETSRDERWARLAVSLVALFRRAFLDPGSGTLGENFTQAWQRAPGMDGDRVEPGHQAEWIWLLDRHQALVGEATSDLIRPLVAVCLDHGTAPDTGLVHDEIGRDGSLRRGTARLWPQTEMLKAHCVRYRTALAAADPVARRIAEAAIVRSADNLLGRYLVGVGVGAGEGGLPPGTWIDQLDEFGRPAVASIPTSSFYHVMSAWVELDGLPVVAG